MGDVVKKSVVLSKEADQMVREVLADMIKNGEKYPSYSKALDKLVKLGYEVYKGHDLPRPKG